MMSLKHDQQLIQIRGNSYTARCNLYASAPRPPNPHFRYFQ